MLWNFYFVNVFLVSLSGVIEDNRLPANFFQAGAKVNKFRTCFFYICSDGAEGLTEIQELPVMTCLKLKKEGDALLVYDKKNVS